MTKYADRVTDELSDMPLMEKKYSTNYVDKGTDELTYMKQKVNTIHRKVLYQFEVQSIGSNGWFKLDIEFRQKRFLKLIQNSIRNCLKRVSKIKTWNCIKCLLYRLIYN